MGSKSLVSKLAPSEIESFPFSPLKASCTVIHVICPIEMSLCMFPMLCVSFGSVFIVVNFVQTYNISVSKQLQNNPMVYNSTVVRNQCSERWSFRLWFQAVKQCANYVKLWSHWQSMNKHWGSVFFLSFKVWISFSPVSGFWEALVKWKTPKLHNLHS